MRSHDVTQQTMIANPFQLMLNPEAVLAAVERSERLSQLNRHLCRPLDRPVLGGSMRGDDVAAGDVDGDDDA